MNGKYVLYSIAISIGMVVFCNHYSRDAVGALERQIEAAGVSPQQYSALNALFFMPNVVAPLFISYFVAKVGGTQKFMLISVCVAFFGHFVFALGAQLDWFGLFYFGRLLAGIVYEVIDTLAVIIMGPLFKENWGTIVGLTNGFLRLGSVFTFLMNPYLYSKYNVAAALWFSAFIAVMAVMAEIAAMLAENYLRRHKLIAHGTDSASSEYDQVSMNESVHNAIMTADAEGNGKEMLARTPSANIAQIGSIDGEEDVEPYRHSVSEQQKISWLSQVWATVKEHLPLHEFSYQFYYFLMCGALVYGAMVPFWFIGSKFLQLNYEMTVGTADALMLLPEGAIVVIGPILGMILDRCRASLRLKLALLALACLTLCIFYMLLAYGFAIYGFLATADDDDGKISRHLLASGKSAGSSAAASGKMEYVHVVSVSPYVSMLGLGVSYAFCNSLIWDSIIHILPDPILLQKGSGLFASFLNILPTILPAIIVSCDETYTIEDGQSRSGIVILAIVAIFGGLFGLLAANTGMYDDDEHASEEEGEDDEETAGIELKRCSVANPLYGSDRGNRFVILEDDEDDEEEEGEDGGDDEQQEVDSRPFDADDGKGTAAGRAEQSPERYSDSTPSPYLERIHGRMPSADSSPSRGRPYDARPILGGGEDDGGVASQVPLDYDNAIVALTKLSPSSSSGGIPGWRKRRRCWVMRWLK